MPAVAIAVALMLGLGSAALAQSWEGFPLYPESRELCHQRVYGDGLEIHWTAYTSRAAPQDVVAFYASRLGKPEIEGDEVRFRAAKEGPVQRTLSVHPVGGRYPRCGKDPDPADRTVLIVSHAIGR